MSSMDEKQVKFIIDVTRMDPGDINSLFFKMLQADPEYFYQYYMNNQMHGILSGKKTSGTWIDKTLEGLSMAQYNSVRSLMERNLKVEAIKQTRALTGLGLKEAKDLVEQHNWDWYI